MDRSATPARGRRDFLGDRETQELTFVFADDPADGEVTINVVGFAEP